MLSDEMLSTVNTDSLVISFPRGCGTNPIPKFEQLLVTEHNRIKQDGTVQDGSDASTLKSLGSLRQRGHQGADQGWLFFQQRTGCAVTLAPTNSTWVLSLGLSMNNFAPNHPSPHYTSSHQKHYSVLEVNNGYPLLQAYTKKHADPRLMYSKQATRKETEVLKFACSGQAVRHIAQTGDH